MLFFKIKTFYCAHHRCLSSVSTSHGGHWGGLLMNTWEIRNSFFVTFCPHFPLCSFRLGSSGGQIFDSKLMVFLHRTWWETNAKEKWVTSLWTSLCWHSDMTLIQKILIFKYHFGSRRKVRVFRINQLGTVNICREFSVDPCGRCWDLSQDKWKHEGGTRCKWDKHQSYWEPSSGHRRRLHRI